MGVAPGMVPGEPIWLLWLSGCDRLDKPLVFDSTSSITSRAHGQNAAPAAYPHLVARHYLPSLKNTSVYVSVAATVLNGGFVQEQSEIVRRCNIANIANIAARGRPATVSHPRLFCIRPRQSSDGAGLGHTQQSNGGGGGIIKKVRSSFPFLFLRHLLLLLLVCQVRPSASRTGQ